MESTRFSLVSELVEMTSVARSGRVEREVGLETEEPEGELSVQRLSQTLHELEVAPLGGSGSRWIEPHHEVLAHFGANPMARASADTRASKLAGFVRDLRFAVPDLDFASIEKQRLDGPSPLGDSRGESL